VADDKNTEVKDLARQMVELQNQMAFQEDTVESLNKAIAAQQIEISTLRRQLELLKQRQDETSSASDHPEQGSALERPPHY